MKNSLEMLYKKESFRKSSIDKEGLLHDEFYQKVCQSGWNAAQSNYKNLQCVSSIAPSEGSEWLLDRTDDQHVNSKHEDLPPDHRKKSGVTGDTYNAIFARKAENWSHGDSTMHSRTPDILFRLRKQLFDRDSIDNKSFSRAAKLCCNLFHQDSFCAQRTNEKRNFNCMQSEKKNRQVGGTKESNFEHKSELLLYISLGFELRAINEMCLMCV